MRLIKQLEHVLSAMLPQAKKKKKSNFLVTLA